MNVSELLDPEKMKALDESLRPVFTDYYDQGNKCQHEWIDCPAGICTSDIHDIHCKKCHRHGLRSMTANSDTDHPI